MFFFEKQYSLVFVFLLSSLNGGTSVTKAVNIGQEKMERFAQNKNA